MQIFPPSPPRGKWCHVICTMFRQREVFKIPGSARFCERAIQEACAFPDWIVASVAVSPSQVRLLLRVPRRLSRGKIIKTIRRVAGRAVRNVAGSRNPFRPVWGERAWCFVLRDPRAITAVRYHMATQRVPYSSAPSVAAQARSASDLSQ